jgi:hypothetical protein
LCQHALVEVQQLKSRSIQAYALRTPWSLAETIAAAAHVLSSLQFEASHFSGTLPRPEAYTQEMIYRAAILALTLCNVLPAQDTPSTKISDYPAQGKIPAVEIGAEYLLNSIPLAKGIYVARNHLVLEVAMFPYALDGVNVSNSQFTLRINYKTILHTDSSGAVAASLKYPDWQSRPNMTAEAGVGNASVILGAPPAIARFPGDPTPNRRPVPTAPDSPDPRAGQPKVADEPIETQLAMAALPEGWTKTTVKGFLFFQFSGKTKSIRNLDLIYDGGESGQMTIHLF